MSNGESLQDEIKSALSYDRFTGVFTWLIKPTMRMNVGDIAGGVGTSGYWLIRYKSKSHLAHRLAFIIETGSCPRFPEFEIDHIDGNKLNNSWSNLRVVSRVENMRNRGRLRRQSKSGITGVSWNANSKKWRVHIGDGSRKISIYKDNLLDAVAERFRLKKALGYTQRHGQ